MRRALPVSCDAKKLKIISGCIGNFNAVNGGFFMFGLSMGEVVFLTLLALILFGNEKLPENLKKFLNGWQKFRKTSLDVQRSWYSFQADLQHHVNAMPDPATDAAQTPALADSGKSSATISVKPLEHLVEQDDIDAYQERNVDNDEPSAISSIPK